MEERGCFEEANSREPLMISRNGVKTALYFTKAVVLASRGGADGGMYGLQFLVR